MRHIRDGHDCVEATLVLGIVIGGGPHGVVVVASVRRVDCNERHVSQIDAVSERRWLSPLGLVKNGLGKAVWYAVRVNGDQADRARLGRATHAFDDFCPGQPHGAFARRFDDDNFAVECTRHVAFSDVEVVARLLVYRFHAPRATELAKHADCLSGCCSKAPNDLGFETLSFRLEANECAIADA